MTDEWASIGESLDITLGSQCPLTIVNTSNKFLDKDFTTKTRKIPAAIKGPPMTCILLIS